MTATMECIAKQVWRTVAASTVVLLYTHTTAYGIAGVARSQAVCYKTCTTKRRSYIPEYDSQNDRLLENHCAFTAMGTHSWRTAH